MESRMEKFPQIIRQDRLVTQSLAMGKFATGLTTVKNLGIIPPSILYFRALSEMKTIFLTERRKRADTPNVWKCRQINKKFTK